MFRGARKGKGEGNYAHEPGGLGGKGGAHPKREGLARWGYFLFPDAEPGYFSLLRKCLPFFSLAQHPSPSLTHHKHKSSYLLALTHLVFDL